MLLHLLTLLLLGCSKKRQRHPARLGPHFQDLQVQLLPLFDDLTGRVNALLDKLADRQEALDLVLKQFNECSRAHDAVDPTLDGRTWLNLLAHALPRVRKNLPATKRDALLLAVNVEHNHAQCLAHLAHI